MQCIRLSLREPAADERVYDPRGMSAANSPPDTEPEMMRGGRQLRQGLVCAVGLLVLGLFLWQQLELTGATIGFPLDDSYIHLQFAQNLAQGNGLAFMPERPVPASTSPLWTALLAPAAAISPSAAMGWAKALGALFFLLAAADLSGFARDLGARRSTSLLAGVLMVLTETLAFSALSGMEVSLFVWLLVRGLRCWSREEARNCGALVTPAIWVLLVSALARPEGLLVVALALTERVVRSRWSGGRGRSREIAGVLALGGLILVPTFGLFLWWSGSPLPTTFTVKAGSGHQWLPSTRDLFRFTDILFRVQPAMTVLAGAGAISLLRRNRSLLPALWLFGLPIAYSALNAPGQPVLLGNFGRYAFPLLPFVVLLGCLGLEDLMTHAREYLRLNGHLGRSVAAIGVAIVVLPCVFSTLNGAGRSALAVRNVEQSDVRAARWIQDNLPGQRIGAQDIGALGLFSDAQVVDLVGLVNPEILPFLRGSRQGNHPSGLGGLLEFVGASRVSYLLLFPRSYGGIDNLRSIRPDLEIVQRFKVERNVAMADDELVLLRLPPASAHP